MHLDDSNGKAPESYLLGDGKGHALCPRHLRRATMKRPMHLYGVDSYRSLYAAGRRSCQFRFRRVICRSSV